MSTTLGKKGYNPNKSSINNLTLNYTHEYRIILKLKRSLSKK